MPDAWNRLRYSFWARWYDRVVAAVEFDDARRRSIERLGLREGQRVLIVGAGTGLDLPHIPRGVRIAAVDVTPAMLERLEARASELGVAVQTQVLDARRLPFADGEFDGVIMHLVLAVMSRPDEGLAEAVRV